MFIEKLSKEAVRNAVIELQAQPDDALMLLVGQDSASKVGDVIEAMQGLDIPFLGGIFPSVISGPNRYRAGMTISRLPKTQRPLLLRNISRGDYDLSSLHAQQTDHKPTVVVLLDGLSHGLSKVLSSLYHRLGSEVSYFGGGAGFLTNQEDGAPQFARRPCIFDANGIYEDAAVIAIMNSSSALTVGHGWTRLFGPLVATRSEGPVIHELNWEPAFEVYRRLVEPHAGQRIEREAFFDVAKFYPFEVVREGDALVRVTIGVTPQGSLICGGEILEESVLNVLTGTPDTLIRAADSVGRLAPAPTETSTVLVVDCVSRWMILGDRFAEELDSLHMSLQERGMRNPMIGALTLGEIGSDGRRFVEYHNKTIVVNVLHDESP